MLKFAQQDLCLEVKRDSKPKTPYQQRGLEVEHNGVGLFIESRMNGKNELRHSAICNDPKHRATETLRWLQRKKMKLLEWSS